MNYESPTTQEGGRPARGRAASLADWTSSARGAAPGASALSTPGAAQGRGSSIVGKIRSSALRESTHANVEVRPRASPDRAFFWSSFRDHRVADRPALARTWAGGPRRAARAECRHKHLKQPSSPWPCTTTTKQGRIVSRFRAGGGQQTGHGRDPGYTGADPKGPRTGPEGPGRG